MDFYSGEELAQKLRGGISFASEAPPPGPLLDAARAALPALTQSPAIERPGITFDMSGLFCKGPGMGGGPA